MAKTARSASPIELELARIYIGHELTRWPPICWPMKWHLLSPHLSQPAGPGSCLETMCL